MLLIHIIALSTAFTMSIVYGLTAWRWIKTASIVLGGSYVVYVTTSIFDLGVNPFDNTQISEFFLKSFLLYFTAAIAGFLITSPKKHFKIVLNILTSKKFLRPVGISIGVALFPFFVESALRVVYRFVPEVDKYQETPPIWLDELAVINKGLALPDIMDVTMNRYEKIIRIYSLKAFEKEKMIELKFKRDSLSVAALIPNEKSIEEDRHYQYFDEYGQATGGGYYTLKAYLPAVSITSYNLTSIEAIQEFVDSLNSFSITEMQSITRGLLFGSSICSCFDCPSIILDVKNNDQRNTIAFWAITYDDYRYNWLSEKFPIFFTLIQKFSTSN